MEENFRTLPEDCWDLILGRVGHHSHFEPLSLVCKSFLSLTNCLRREFVVTRQTIIIHGSISRFLYRFPNLNSIDLSRFREFTPYCSFDALLCEIADSSSLDLRSIDISNQARVPIKGLKHLASSKMINLSVLKCANLTILNDDDLEVIAAFFPCLEELDVSHPRNLSGNCDCNLKLTDRGIEALSSNLKKLRKLNISGFHFISDSSIFLLSCNCVLLSEIIVKDCLFLSINAVRFLLNNSHNLCSVSTSLNFPCAVKSLDNYLIDTFPTFLSSLHFYDMIIPDESLYSLATACLPLKRLSLSRCTEYSLHGIEFLLQTYTSLEYLALERAFLLTDKFMYDISKCMCNLGSISLKSCDKLSEVTFFTLLESCPKLGEIEMEHTALGDVGTGVTDFVKNTRINSLKLAKNSDLSDDFLKKIGLSCPELQLLDLSCCGRITGEGIAEVLNNCSEIRELNISGCQTFKTIGIRPCASKLEILSAAYSGINDECLLELRWICCNLLALNLEGCWSVTEKGLDDVLRNFKSLKEINLKFCPSDITRVLLFLRPSLRKIVNHREGLTKDMSRLFLAHGIILDTN